MSRPVFAALVVLAGTLAAVDGWPEWGTRSSEAVSLKQGGDDGLIALKRGDDDGLIALKRGEGDGLIALERGDDEGLPA